MTQKIPFNWPHVTGDEWEYVRRAIEAGHLSGDGLFTKQCSAWLESRLGTKHALLTHSCTAALEMAAILFDICPGDEVVMPSFTFVSTANAFALRGGIPVFVDIRPDTLNLDERLIEAAITPKTKAIVPVHYAGNPCEMATILEIATAHGVPVVEDAAQAIGAKYRGQALGTIGALGTLSFHETKNVISGEGGALLVNDERYFARAEVIREKGTNRAQYFQGHVDKYTWVDIGSSFLPSEIIAAFLLAQLERCAEILARRRRLWLAYDEALQPLEAKGLLRRPKPACPDWEPNHHMYYILLPDAEMRPSLIRSLAELGVHSVFHYVPLHSSPAGQRLGRVSGTMSVTDHVSATLLRLPFWTGMDEVAPLRVADALAKGLKGMP